jgi:hypothetical protein
VTIDIHVARKKQAFQEWFIQSLQEIEDNERSPTDVLGGALRESSNPAGCWTGPCDDSATPGAGQLGVRLTPQRRPGFRGAS